MRMPDTVTLLPHSSPVIARRSAGRPPALSDRTRFTALDSWRGVCALLVALHHFVTAGHISELQLIRNASLFVDFFFVLSGFVITHAYGRRMRSREDAVVFLLKRIGRIWPLHLVMLLSLVGLEAIRATMLDGGTGEELQRIPFTGANAWFYILPNALLLHSLGFLHSLSWNIPSWSISVEMAAYLIFALACVMPHDQLRWLSCVMVALSILVLARMPVAYVDAIETYGVFRCLAGFFVGHLIYRLFRQGGGPGSSVLPATLLELTVVTTLVIFVSWFGAGRSAVLAPFLFGVTVYIFASQGGALSRLLLRGPFTLLGKLSYSIYMVHYPIVLVIGAIATFVGKRLGLHLLVQLPSSDGVAEKALNFGSSWANDLVTVMFLATSIAVAAVTYRFIELPGQRAFEPLLRARGTGRLSAGQAE